MSDAVRASIDATIASAAAKAALYLRVSTGRQAESDLSIPDQRRQIMAYCVAKGWDVQIRSVRNLALTSEATHAAEPPDQCPK